MSIRCLDILGHNSVSFIAIYNSGTANLGPLAQLVEHLTFNQVVTGSTPVRPTYRPRRLAWPRTPAFHAGDTGSNPVGDVQSLAPSTRCGRGFFLAMSRRGLCSWNLFDRLFYTAPVSLIQAPEGRQVIATQPPIIQSGLSFNPNFNGQ